MSTSSESDTTYKSNIDGTSFATPLVASVAALMLSANPNLTPAQVRSYLYSNSYPLNSVYFNCGLLNAGWAVERAKYEDFKNRNLILSSVTAKSGAKIKLQWTTNGIYDTNRVQIYRSTSKNGTYTKIDAINGRDGNYYTDKNCKAGKTYYYKVRVSMKYGDTRKCCNFSGIKSAKAKK